jgi:hypothetical protein
MFLVLGKRILTSLGSSGLIKDFAHFVQDIKASK